MLFVTHCHMLKARARQARANRATHEIRPLLSQMRPVIAQQG
jgi:hypothetical protein